MALTQFTSTAAAAPGDADPSFLVQVPEELPQAMAVTPGDEILVGGYFDNIGGQPYPGFARPYFARLHANGSLDTTFGSIGANRIVRCVVEQPDGRILIAGEFDTIHGTTRNYVARLEADGSLDTTFNPNPNNVVYSPALLPNGKILIGGFFSTVGGLPRGGIARLLPGGAPDPGFAPASNGRMFTIIPQADGKVLLGGIFDIFNGTPATRSSA